MSQQTLFEHFTPEHVAAVRAAWSTPCATVDDFETRICTYQSYEVPFAGLRAALSSTAATQRAFFDIILPHLQRLVLEAIDDSDLQQRCSLLTSSHGSATAVTLSRYDVSQLLALCALCAIPRRTERSETSGMPACNFASLYNRVGASVEKLKMHFAYWERVASDDRYSRERLHGERVVVRRRSLARERALELVRSDRPLCEVVVESETTKIEECEAADVHVDFANKYIGGGVLRNGSVQEEIRFSISPELLVACMLCSRLLDEDAVDVVGASEIFSSYSGYGGSLRFGGPRDDSARTRHAAALAIDATSFRGRSPPHAQFTVPYVEREVAKAVSGFLGAPATTIATGNWGCGVFGGDLPFKFALQWLAATAAGVGGGVTVRLHYCTFGDRRLPVADLRRFCESVVARRLTAGILWRYVLQYAAARVRGDANGTLFQYVEALREPTTGALCPPYQWDYAPYTHARTLQALRKRRKLAEATEQQRLWGVFYRDNQTNFFRDRHWLQCEFAEEYPRGGELVFDAGCGVGNTFLPLLGESPRVRVVACDFAESGIELIRSNPLYQQHQERVVLFVCDLSSDTALRDSLQATRLFDEQQRPLADVALLIFVLSAMTDAQMQRALQNVGACMRSGGHVLVRDYAVGDLAEERFRARGNGGVRPSLDEIDAHGHLFVREGDSTLANFLDEARARHMVEKAGLRMQRLEVVERTVENRKQASVMQRRFMQFVARRP